MKDLLLWILMVLCGLGSLPTVAQEWQVAYDQALDAYEQNDLAAAERAAGLSLRLAEEQFGADSEPYSYSAQLAAVACYESGQFGKGIEYAQREVESNRLRQVHDTIYAKAASNLLLNYQGAGEVSLAIGVIRQLLPIYLLHYGEQSLQYNLALSDLANGQIASGKSDTALILLEQANNSLALIPQGGEDYLTNLYQIAVLEYELGSLDLALRDLSALRQILKENGLENELIYAQVLDQVGAIHYGKEDLGNAEQSYTRAIGTYQMHYSDPEDYSPVLVDLAAIYLKTGRKEKSDSIMALLPGSKGDSNILINKINLATTKYHEGAISESLQYYQEIIESAEFGNLTDEHLRGDVFTNYASVNLEARNYQEALRAIDHIIPYYRQTGNMAKLGKALNIRARVYNHLGDIEPADSDHWEAFELLPQLSPEVQYIVASDLMDFCYTHSRFQEAQDVYDRASKNELLKIKLQYNLALVTYSLGNLVTARDMLDALPDKNLKVKITLGVVNLELDDFPKAEACFMEVEKVLIKNGKQNSDLYGENLINRGRLSLNLGNYSEAETHYLQGLEILEGSADPVGYANALNAVAIFYQTLGNYDAAFEYYIQAKSVYHESSADLADLLQNMATLYQLNGQENESILLLREALVIYKAIYGDKHPYYGVALQNLASAQEKKGSFEEAELLFQQALKIDLAVYGENHHSSANKMHNLAVLYQDNNQYDASLELFKRVITIRQELLGEHHPDYIYSVYGLAVLYHKMGEIDQAKPHFDHVVREYLHHVQNYFPFLSEKEKSAFYLKIKEIFEAYYDFAVEYSLKDKSILAELFNLNMATKAILLSASNTIRRTILDSEDPELVQHFNRWARLKEELIRAYGLSREQLVENQTDIKSLEHEANQIEKLLSLKSVEFTSRQNARNPKWTDIQSALNDDQAVVDILRIRKNIKNDSILYIALVITPNTQGSPAIIIMPNGKEMEGKWFRGYINTMRYQIRASFGFEHFWKPLDSHLEGVETVYFSPDGIYNKINLNTLQYPDSFEYLVDKTEVRYLTKASQLLQPSGPPAVGKRANLFGFPNFGQNSVAKNVTRFNRIIELPGTKRELEQVHDLLEMHNWNSQVYLQGNATEERIKGSASVRILHIATHGFFLEDSRTTSENVYNLDDNPLLRCGLLLTGSQEAFKGDRIVFNTNPEGEDGILTAYEVMNLDLRKTELVVLSACETALGEVENGEGVYGLQRAFITSGVQSVVMSLWKVDDFATQELMVNFYQHFLNGDDKFLAFAKAQKMIRSKYEAPYYWGAFIINGI